MERKIGETFEYEGEKLKVIKAGTACDGCYFKGKSCDNRNYDITGICGWTRKDNQPVRFIKVTEEQQAEQPQKLNLCEILKDCPEGTKLYSPLFGEVDFQRIRSDDENAIVITKGVVTVSFTKEGFYYPDLSEECLLFPSKEHRDWSKFTAPWLKKERFDPKTLKAFDKVLVFDSDRPWTPLMFSYLEYTLNYPRMQCFDFVARKVIPYNDDTKHLVGTKEEAPEFYKYWEE